MGTTHRGHISRMALALALMSGTAAGTLQQIEQAEMYAYSVRWHWRGLGRGKRCAAAALKRASKKRRNIATRSSKR